MCCFSSFNSAASHPVCIVIQGCWSAALCTRCFGVHSLTHTPSSISVSVCKHTGGGILNPCQLPVEMQRWTEQSGATLGIILPDKKRRPQSELTLFACGLHEDTIQTGKRAKKHFDNGKHPALLAPRQQLHRTWIVRSTQCFYCGEECLNSHTTRQRAAESCYTHAHSRRQTRSKGPMMS